MEQIMFLKLNGVCGESENPRHFGEIEILGFTWGGSYLQSSGGRRRASFHDLTVMKKANKSSHFLLVASNSGRSFANGALIVENISQPKKIVRTTRIEMSSVQIGTFISDGETDSFALNFGSLRMVG